MKKTIRFCAILLALLSTSFAASASERPNIELPEIGLWRGHIFKPKLGYLLEWVHDVRSDGTYEDHFTRYYIDGKKEQAVESGKWWIKDNSYFEFIPVQMDKPDEYRILLVNDNFFVIQIKDADGSTLNPSDESIYVHQR